MIIIKIFLVGGSTISTLGYDLKQRLKILVILIFLLPTLSTFQVLIELIQNIMIKMKILLKQIISLETLYFPLKKRVLY